MRFLLFLFSASSEGVITSPASFKFSVVSILPPLIRPRGTAARAQVLLSCLRNADFDIVLRFVAARYPLHIHAVRFRKGAVGDDVAVPVFQFGFIGNADVAVRVDRARGIAVISPGNFFAVVPEFGLHARHRRLVVRITVGKQKLQSIRK